MNYETVPRDLKGANTFYSEQRRIPENTLPYSLF